MEDMVGGVMQAVTGGSVVESIPLSGPPLNPLTLGSLSNSPLCLKLRLLNARSVNNKTCLVQDLILDQKSDLACITA